MQRVRRTTVDLQWRSPGAFGPASLRPGSTAADRQKCCRVTMTIGNLIHDNNPVGHIGGTVIVWRSRGHGGGGIFAARMQ